MDAPDPTIPLAETREVSHDFPVPGGKPLRVLEGIRFGIQRSEVVAILGPSGCGKSTLLRILAGLIQPTKGEVLDAGKPLAGLRSDVAIVFQSFALFPWMTVEQNIRVVLRAAELPDDVADARTEQVIHAVGLAGFESHFPRELSGGMKQRVGIARALAIDPLLLFLDEPFSAIDALTAETLRAEVIDLWAAKDRRLTSILMVSHDIPEVVYMADRLVVMGAHPGRVRKVVENRLPRPRDYRSPEFLWMVDQLHDLITKQEMPDAASDGAAAGAAGAPAPTIESPPHVSPSEIIGLLEYLDARRGREDVFKIASDTQREYGALIPVVNAAEMLGFVDTPKRTAVLNPDGAQFVKADLEGRRAIWRKQLLELRLFRDLHDLVERAPDRVLDADVALSYIVTRLPQEDYEKVFETFVGWSRYGQLVHFDAARETLSL